LEVLTLNDHKNPRGNLTYANVMATIAAFLALGGGALALGGVIDHQGRIRACYEKRGPNQGQLRLLAKGKCRRGEKAISWARQGPPGTQGSPGPASGPAGGDLTGNYPDPSIADSSISSPAVLDGSLRLADISRSVTGNFGGAVVPAQGCRTNNAAFPSLQLRTGDVGLPVFLQPLPAGVLLRDLPFASEPESFPIELCNVTSSPVTLPNPFEIRFYAIHP
jgi:hypothetical protein